jgi:hypothetical protein
VREVPPKGGEAKNYLFRIQEDPNEQNDLSAQNPKMVADLLRGLEEWRKLYPPNGVRDTDGQPKDYKAPKLWAEAAKD